MAHLVASEIPKAYRFGGSEDGDLQFLAVGLAYVANTSNMYVYIIIKYHKLYIYISIDMCCNIHVIKGSQMIRYCRVTDIKNAK